MGSASFLPNVSSTITCSVHCTVFLYKIMYLEIKSLVLQSCIGGDNPSREKAVLAVVSVESFCLADCNLKDNRFLLYLYRTRMVLQNNVFEGNEAIHGGALLVYHSTVVLTRHNTFLGNNASVHGGGIAVLIGEVVFRGSAVFSNNYAESGGSIHAAQSNITFEGDMEMSEGCFLRGELTSFNTNCDSCTLHTHTRFVQNLAQRGGGITLRESTMEHTGGALIFAGNEATSGGAVFCSDDSGVIVYGATLFTDNSVLEKGGAVYMEYSEMIAESKNVSFHRNSADINGGGIYTSSSKIVVYSGRMSFVGNMAGEHGGGIMAHRSTTHFRSGNTRFLNNTALNGGGIFADSLSNVWVSANCLFAYNIAQVNGGALYLYYSEFSSTELGVFSNNIAGISGGVLFAKSCKTMIIISGDTCLAGNSALFGGALLIEDCSFNFTGWALFLSNSGKHGGAIFAHRDSHLMLSGEYKFHSNEARYGGYGGGIRAYGSSLKLCGSFYFVNNSADYGGGLAIADYDQEKRVVISRNTTVIFHGNHARTRGGAIMVEDSPLTYCINLEAQHFTRECFLSLDSHGCFGDTRVGTHLHEFLQKRNISLRVRGNLAKEGGDSLYGGALEECKICYSTFNSGKYYQSGIEVMTELISQDIADNQRSITSDPLRVCVCGNDTLRPNCTQKVMVYKTYPGATTSFRVFTLGQANGAVPAVVYAKLDNPRIWIHKLQNTQPTSINCTFLDYTFFTNEGNESTTLALFTEGPCGDTDGSLVISVEVLPCPEGFTLSPLGTCDCDKRLQKHTQVCNITNQSFTRTTNFWLGFDSRGLALHPHCPFDYCKLETIVLTLDSSDMQCVDGRTGVLCGACKPGLSLNLGTSQCSPCSNMYLPLLVVFGFAGFLLVIFLFTCEVTVSDGTISGLIFYSNIVAVNQSTFFPSRGTNFFTVFIAWMNLDFGIQTCLFDGMDAYTHTWLQFLFPIYIWVLAGAVTLVSNYSTKFARIIGPTNPVAILATLFLLSYTKLLRTIVATFAFTTIAYPNEESINVWLYDGNIRWLEGKHIILFLVGILAVVFLFLPYTLLLLFGQCAVAQSNYRLLSWMNNLKIRAFLDAYHAPYKSRFYCWVGLLLLLRLVLFTTAAVIDFNSPRDPSVNLLVLSIVCAGFLVLVWNCGTMYRKWYNNFLESAFIFNLAILAAATYQVKVEHGKQEIVVYISVCLAFIKFLGIITYHVTKRMKATRIWRHSIEPTLHQLKETLLNHQHTDTENCVEMTTPPIASPRPVPTTFVELREPLLDTSC